MHVVVIGMGAIGSLIGGKLARAGHPVTLVGRPHQVEALHSRPLTVEEVAERHEIPGVHAVTSLAEAARGRPIDLLIVTVKAYDTGAVADEIAALDAVPGHVLTLQNGVGNEETLAERVGAPRVLAGAVTTPVEVVAPGHVRVARPTYRLGLAPVEPTAAANDVVHQVGDALACQGFRVQYVADYRALKWTKLLFNITANAQAAILAWTPAQVFAHPPTGALEVRAWREALAVMKALGIRPLAFGGYPLPLAVPLIRHLPLPWVRVLLGLFASGGRGGKMPSVYLDLQRGRGQTEVPWLNGAVFRRGQEVGVPAPVNQTLDVIVDAIATGRMSWGDVREQPERLARAVALAEQGRDPLEAYGDL